MSADTALQDFPAHQVDGHGELTSAIPPLARLLKRGGGCSADVRHAVPMLQDAALARPPKTR